jgi:bifunctional NMN adenylyltransferase/nudix hydrolase
MKQIAVVIGRFQPFHWGHYALMQEAMAYADHLVVFVGTTGAAPDTRNPWSYQEVSDMILSALPKTECHVRTLPLLDVPYDDTDWLESIHEALSNCDFGNDTRDAEVLLFGSDKDVTTGYLKMVANYFGWKFHNAPYKSDKVRDATQVREALFTSVTGDWEPVQGMVPPAVFEQLRLMGAQRWIRMHNEMAELLEHRADWDSPGTRKYGSQHVTVDVLASTKAGQGSVLLIKRKGAVGMGTWALPGGFVNKGERIVDAALRELREETGMLPSQGFPKVGATVTFDYPWRDSRGRMFTNVLPIDLDKGYSGAIKAGDDAAELQWFEFSQEGLDKIRSSLFADHYHILRHFLNKKGTL